MQQPSDSTSTATARITSSNRSTTVSSPIVATTNAAPTTTNTVTSNASDQTSRLANMIKTYRRATLLKR